MLSREERIHYRLKRLVAIAALAVAALTAVVMATPGTVLADSAADQYAEPQLPQEPPKADNNSGNGSNGQSKSENGAAGNGDGAGASAGSSSGSGASSDSDSDDSEAGAQGGQSDRDQADRGKKDRKSSKADKNEREDGAEQALLGSGSSDDGDGSALPLIALLLIGIPALAAGGYLLYRRYGGGQGDPEMRAKVQEPVSDGKGSSAS